MLLWLNDVCVSLSSAHFISLEISLLLFGASLPSGLLDEDGGHIQHAYLVGTIYIQDQSRITSVLSDSRLHHAENI